MAADAGPPEQAQHLGLERRLRQVALVAALAMLAYLGLAMMGDDALLREGLQRLGPGQWLTLVGLSLCNYGLRFLRWHAYLRTLGARVTLGRGLLIYVAGFAFTVTPARRARRCAPSTCAGWGCPGRRAWRCWPWSGCWISR